MTPSCCTSSDGTPAYTTCSQRKSLTHLYNNLFAIGTKGKKNMNFRLKDIYEGEFIPILSIFCLTIIIIIIITT